jgi:hypothetical protein
LRNRCLAYSFFLEEVTGKEELGKWLLRRGREWVDGTGSGSHPIMGICISSYKPSDSAFRIR